MKKLIKNGFIVDGSGNPGYKADVLLNGGIIEKIAETIEEDGAEIINAEGLVVAPGFIDTHSHSDLQVLVEPEVAPKVLQGITTEILGQDGISMAPLPKEYVSPWRKNLAGLDGDSDLIDWNYETTENYLQMIDDVKPGLKNVISCRTAISEWRRWGSKTVFQTMKSWRECVLSQDGRWRPEP